jgi:hypothetical protein
LSDKIHCFTKCCQNISRRLERHGPSCSEVGARQHKAAHRDKTAPAFIIIISHITSTMTITFESIQRAADGLKASLPNDFVPKIGIIGGSGLSALEKAIEGDRHEISYEQIDGFPVSTGQ